MTAETKIQIKTETDEKILELVKSGKNATEISQILRISKSCLKSRIIRILSDSGVKEVHIFALNCLLNK